MPLEGWPPSFHQKHRPLVGCVRSWTVSPLCRRTVCSQSWFFCFWNWGRVFLSWHEHLVVLENTVKHVAGGTTCWVSPWKRRRSSYVWHKNMWTRTVDEPLTITAAPLHSSFSKNTIVKSSVHSKKLRWTITVRMLFYSEQLERWSVGAVLHLCSENKILNV